VIPSHAVADEKKVAKKSSAEKKSAPKKNNTSVKKPTPKKPVAKTKATAQRKPTAPPKKQPPAPVKKPAPQPAPPKPQPVAAPRAEMVNPITKSFVDLGVLGCASRINQVTGFLTKDTDAGAFLFVPDHHADQQINSASMEIISRDGSAAYGSASFSPSPVSPCSAMYETVAFSPEPCDTVASKLSGNKKITNILKKNIRILTIGPQARIFLMPAGAGCVSIKKELIY
jgi:hypothetical protein